MNDSTERLTTDHGRGFEQKEDTAEGHQEEPAYERSSPSSLQQANEDETDTNTHHNSKSITSSQELHGQVPESSMAYSDDKNFDSDESPNADDDDLRHESVLQQAGRDISACMDDWPRCTALFCRVLLPLWILIAVALGFGHLLSQYEGPNEIINNDSIMQDKYFLDIFPSDEIINELYSLPKDCLEFYISVKRNETTSEDYALLTFVRDVPIPTFPDVPLGFMNQTSDEVLGEIFSYMDVCVNISQVLVDAVIDYTERQTSLEAFEDLTFDWIRCWNNTLYGTSNPFIVDKDQIEAANSQPQFYRQVWNESRAVLYQQYLDEYNCTRNDLECNGTALSQSAADATGSSQCELNTGSSAWFWFTVMTTVGYGNQSPTTRSGRALVAGLGWFSIILFGGVSLAAGSVINVIVRDMFRKLNLKRFAGAFAGTLIWASIAIGWVFFMGFLASDWWQRRVPDFEVDRVDSLWFSYITALTVGLGDYYLQPEVMFISDVFSWSATMLFGFVILTLFLNNFSSLIGGRFPDAGKKLEERLVKSNLRELKVFRYQERNRKGIELLGSLVDEIGRVRDESNRFDALSRKKEVLILLLEQTDIELEEFMNVGNHKSDFASSRDQLTIQKEEEILKRVLDRISRERELMESGGGNVCEKNDDQGKFANLP